MIKERQSIRKPGGAPEERRRVNRNYIIVLLLIVSFYACGSKSRDEIDRQDPPIAVNDDPEQYNVPFKNVPDIEDLTIYQVNMRTFSQEGNFKGVIRRLDSIKALGVNVVYLMPIFPLGQLKAINSPYCIRNYRAINAEFGSLADLRELVDKAHERNMAVILDWVANHTSFDHAWTANSSWYLKDSNGNISSPPGMGWNDVAQLNFNNAEMRRAMIKDMKYWVYAANIDGFRCDYADGPPIDFWKQAIDSLRGISTHKLILLAEGKRSANYTAGFDLNFGFEFFEKLKNIYSKGSSALEIEQLNDADYRGASLRQRIVRYISNHDVNGSDGTPEELFGGAKGAMAAFVIAAYMKSVPMIYNGQEVANPVRLTFPFTSTKIDWTLNPGVTAAYKKVLSFRNNSEAIRRGELRSFSNADIVAFSKKSAAEEVLVFVNVRNKVSTCTVPTDLVSPGWQEVFGQDRPGLASELELAPYSWRVFKK